MAAPLMLKTAVGNYPHTRPLKDGTVTSQRLCLEHVEVNPANRAFRPMVNQLACDVSELALVTLILARALDKHVVGVPVVLMQQSAYGMLGVLNDSPLRDPRELGGRTIGVRAYTQTTGVWLRGMLHDQFGLDLAQYPDLRTLIPDAKHVETDWIRYTGIRPINHTLVVRHDVASAHAWVRDELFRLVQAAKNAAGTGAPADGLEVNRGPLTLLARYTFKQHITPRTLTAEELFRAT